MADANSTDFFNFDDAPGGGSSLDDIFSTSSDGHTSTTQTPAVDNTQSQQVTDETVTAEPILKTSTGTVYNTIDDAVKGIEHKDALIAQLRQQVQQATTVDPLKKPTETVERPQSFQENPKEYFRQIHAAKDETELIKIQAQFINEIIAPYAPAFANMVKSQAVDSVAQEMPKFREFLGSDEYKATLESFPLLKQSIEISEQYPERSGDLGQLYRLAFDSAAGRNLPKIVASSGSTTPVQTRPTVSSTPATPPPLVKSVPPSFGTTDGRKSIIEQQEAAGVGNLRF